MSLRTAPTGRHSHSRNPDGGRVHLHNEESQPRTVTVVVRGGADGTSVEDVPLPAGAATRIELPATDEPLAVGCHSDDGRSGVRTHRPDDAGPVVFSLREGSILLDGG
jgi:hypothetical protein